jgi:hypothetical protein
MNAHQLDANGIIINTIVVEALDVLPNLVSADIGGSIGDSVIDGALIPRTAPPAVPESIPKLNARLILIEAGCWDDVVAFATEQGPVALAFLEDAQTMRRDNALVNAWAASRGKTDKLDGWFIAGAALNVDEYA